jgi:hypothetical protein
MLLNSSADRASATQNQFTTADVEAILLERGWLEPVALHESKDPARQAGEHSLSELRAWLADATALLGPHAVDRTVLADLLSLVFNYDAATILAAPENHAVLAREGAREVVRGLANRVLDGPEIDSDRFKEIVNEMKDALPYRGRHLFYPVRLALAGRAGEGELDRVILLLDRAAKLRLRVAVKGARQRILEFCAALD